MNVYARGKIVAWFQGRYECFECSYKGKVKTGVLAKSRCGKCSSDLILPLPDVNLKLIK